MMMMLMSNWTGSTWKLTILIIKLLNFSELIRKPDCIRNISCYNTLPMSTVGGGNGNIGTLPCCHYKKHHDRHFRLPYAPPILQHVVNELTSGIVWNCDWTVQCTVQINVTYYNRVTSFSYGKHSIWNNILWASFTITV